MDESTQVQRAAAILRMGMVAADTVGTPGAMTSAMAAAIQERLDTAKSDAHLLDDMLKEHLMLELRLLVFAARITGWQPLAVLDYVAGDVAGDQQLS